MSSIIASCTNPTTTWTFNTLGQSPCEVASYLGGTCFNGVYNVPPLNENQTLYSGPAAGSASDCECNTVRYSILSACAACQSQDFLPWPIFSGNCTRVFVGDFPKQIPSYTRIPHYAFLSLGTDNRFNLTAAQAVANLPETAAATPTTGPSPPSSASNSSKAVIGAIVAGVIGGLACLGLIALLVVWLHRRHKRSKMEPPDSSNGSLMTEEQASPPVTALPIYDPSDPSTFPSPSPFTQLELDRQRGYNGQPEI